MQKLKIDPELFDLFPDAQLGVLVLDGLDNHVKEERISHYQALLDEATQAAGQFITVDPFRDNPVVASWRKAYQAFKTKKGARSSIEAMLKRVSQGRQFSPINPIVDLYNCISLTYGVPVGGEDLAKVAGDLRLGVATGGEDFRPLGADEDEPALPGEVIYYDQTGANVRCWNWREAQRTMLVEETQRTALVVEAAYADQQAQVQKAVYAMQELFEQELQVKGRVAILTRNNPEVQV
ncbi:B3/4 domain-containing protein [uncultured Secundilactobacillus sp.]|uniref:B3/B4 domain-containing protein n=1 Tax=uncultured Secundilactobacillus sp. TaxID=2813935 RepID=UPI00258C34BF|nr:phenylalanine--tRNA ligase beta subunit-related protein [uncultured Secundilactobacillus sp.]